jgi:hypothetical protein
MFIGEKSINSWNANNGRVDKPIGTPLIVCFFFRNASAKIDRRQV